jgi:hypothetical protein
MDETLFFLGLVLAVAIMVAVFYIYYQESRALDEVFQRVARRYSGRAFSGGLIAPVGFSFRYGGGPVKIEAKRGGKNESDYTQIQFSWPDPSTRCEIYPERFTSRLGRLFGMTDVEIGSPEFDRTFVVAGDSEARLRELLSPEVQQAIRGFWSAPPIGDIYFSIGGGKMLVKKLALIREENALARFVEAALHLYDCVSGPRSEGIQFLAESSPEAPAEIICQVCGDAIEHELIHCRRCRTPHHEDCWKYFGGCSTFGCGEKRYTSR